MSESANVDELAGGNAPREDPIKLKMYTLLGRLGADECGVTLTATPAAYAIPEFRESFEGQARGMLLHGYPGVTVLDGEWSDYEMPREDYA